MARAETVAELVEAGDGDSVAIAAPARASLGYAALRAQLAASVRRLNDLGVGRNDCVAIVLSNGPAMASAFLAIAAAATAAPLNPAYREDEFRFYL